LQLVRRQYSPSWGPEENFGPFAYIHHRDVEFLALDRQNEWLYVGNLYRIRACSDPSYEPDALDPSMPCVRSLGPFLRATFIVPIIILVLCLVVAILLSSFIARANWKSHFGLILQIFSGYADVCTDFMLFFLVNPRSYRGFVLCASVSGPILVACVISCFLGNAKFLPYLLCASLPVVEGAPWCKVCHKKIQWGTVANLVSFLVLEELPQLALEIGIYSVITDSASFVLIVLAFCFTCIGIVKNTRKLYFALFCGNGEMTDSTAGDVAEIIGVQAIQTIEIGTGGSS